MSPAEPLVGIVLAGGRSSRMGTNKALLDYHGRPLIEHMMTLLRAAGCTEVRIAGRVPGYPGHPDPADFPGPARALDALLAGLSGFSGALVVPVDMPLLPPEALTHLARHGKTACYADHPLPAFIRLPVCRSMATSMGALLDDFGGRRLPLPEVWAAAMVNLNTPDQWQQALDHEPAPLA